MTNCFTRDLCKKGDTPEAFGKKFGQQEAFGKKVTQGKPLEKRYRVCIALKGTRLNEKVLGNKF